jgi:two-component system chemotaxis family response regulator WspR
MNDENVQMDETPTLSDAAAHELSEFKVRVLLLDDQLMIVEAVRRMLGDQPDIEFHYLTDTRLALETARQLRPTVILQDLVMPVIGGLDAIRLYRDDPLLRDIPVIVLSSGEDAKLKADSFGAGANDYVVKLPDRLELLARIRYHSNAYIHRLQRDQAFHFLRESQQALVAANIELQQLAALDGLTGIANRRGFDQTLALEWQRGQRAQTPLSLLICDIDFFKLYNDSLGHLAGDLCLKKVAAALTAQLKRPADLAARYGGEEFAILLPDTTADGALNVAHACRRQLASLGIAHPQAPVGIVTLSIGVASMLPAPASTLEQLIRHADLALYAAKRGGRDQVRQAADLPELFHQEGSKQ